MKRIDITDMTEDLFQPLLLINLTFEGTIMMEQLIDIKDNNALRHLLIQDTLFTKSGAYSRGEGPWPPGSSKGVPTKLTSTKLRAANIQAPAGL